MHLPGLRKRLNLRARALLSLGEGVEISSSKLVKVRITSKSHASLLIMGTASAAAIFEGVDCAGIQNDLRNQG
jgi:hypothetical protein